MRMIKQCRHVKQCIYVEILNRNTLGSVFFLLEDARTTQIFL